MTQAPEITQSTRSLRVRVAHLRRPICGDMMASRAAIKGIIGVIGPIAPKAKL